MCIIAERADQTLSRSTLSRSTLSRSGVEPPTGTIHPRKNPATESPCPRCPLSFPSVLSRSGVEPPTGTIHPRESRETADRKQVKRFTSDNTFQNLELLEPVGGCTPDRNDPPPQGHGSGVPSSTLSRSGVAPPTGTIHPRKITSSPSSSSLSSAQRAYRRVSSPPPQKPPN